MLGVLIGSLIFVVAFSLIAVINLPMIHLVNKSRMLVSASLLYVAGLLSALFNSQGPIWLVLAVLLITVPFGLLASLYFRVVFSFFAQNRMNIYQPEKKSNNKNQAK